ncbi:MAG TPA: O-antigen ligase family protein [Terracidiphilus sp.]|jgi:exopolysaccharide production protein ExoQ
MMDKIFLAGAYLVMGAVVLRYIRPVCIRFREQVLITMVCALAALSTAWSQDPLTTAKDAVFLVISVGFVYAIKARYSIEQQMEIMMLLGVVFGALCSVAAIAHPSTGLDSMHGRAWQGICFSKNHFGRMCVFLLTPALHYSGKAAAAKLFRVVYVLAIVSLVALSESRTAWIALLLYVLYAGTVSIINKFGCKSAQAMLVFIVPLTISILALCLINFQEVMAVFNRDPSLTGRREIWSVLMISIQKHPMFGFGYRAFFAGAQSEGANAIVALFALMHFMPEYAHSGYLSVVLEVGVVGLGLVIALICRALRYSRRCLGVDRAKYTEWYVGLVFLTIVVNATEVTFMIPSYLPWLLFILAVVGLSEDVRSRPGEILS